MLWYTATLESLRDQPSYGSHCCLRIRREISFYGVFGLHRGEPNKPQNRIFDSQEESLVFGVGSSVNAVGARWFIIRFLKKGLQIDGCKQDSWKSISGSSHSHILNTVLYPLCFKAKRNGTIQNKKCPKSICGSSLSDILKMHPYEHFAKNEKPRVVLSFFWRPFCWCFEFACFTDVSEGRYAFQNAVVNRRHCACYGHPKKFDFVDYFQITWNNILLIFDSQEDIFNSQEESTQPFAELFFWALRVHRVANSIVIADNCITSSHGESAQVFVDALLKGTW